MSVGADAVTDRLPTQSGHRGLRLPRAGKILIRTASGGAVPLVVPALILALWWVAADRHWMSEQVLPTPALVWETARELFADHLWENLWISIQRLLLGLAAGVTAGAVLGVLMGASRRAESILYPTFLALVQVPTLAWIPLLIMLLGLGEALKVAVIVKAVITPVAIHTHVGVRDTDAKLLEAARVLRLPPWRRFAVLTLPAALPAFMTGLRLGLAQSWTSLLAVELLASAEGIGFLMVWGRQLFQLDVVFVCIAVIGVVGLAMDWGFHRIDGHVVRWPRPAVGAHHSSSRTADGVSGAGAWPLILPAVLLGLWWAATAGRWVDPNFVPGPREVFTALRDGLADGSLPSSLAISLKRSACGLLIGTSLGFLSGLALGLFRPCERLFGGTLAVLRLVAIFAWLPLLTAWVGLGEESKVAFIAIACFFPMQVTTQRGVAGLSPQLAETARVLRLGWGERLRSFILPGSAPAVFAGFRLALVYAWVGTVGAEYFMASGGGIGSLMIAAQQVFRMDMVLCGMLLIGLVAAAIAWAGTRIESLSTRWRSA
ncbi:sulfonate transport system permease protein [Azospirillum baldaniorum]|nr:sulfonate transport system permease protein [Azospirillum baldaniorum]